METLVGSNFAHVLYHRFRISRASRGLSGYRARWRVADSRGPVLVAGLSLNK
jgi:hypothetical protein